MGQSNYEDLYKTAPLPAPEKPGNVCEPWPEGLRVPVDKTKFRVRFVDETENHVEVLIEPKG